MRAAKRAQLSSQLTTQARMHLEPKINDSLILPVFWAEETCQITEDQGHMFASAVYG